MNEMATEVSFSGHETFPFRYAWLKKGVDAVAKNPSIFSDENAMTELGVGKNMVRSIRHWGLASGVLEQTASGHSRSRSGLRVSEFGDSILSSSGFDPYLEDIATLWLLHWSIASTPERASTWFWAFSHLHEPEFTKDGIVYLLLRWAEQIGAKRISHDTLERDVDCFLRTYTPSRHLRNSVMEETLDCPLVELRLLHQSADHTTYSFNRGSQPSLSDRILLYAVSDYWRRNSERSKTLSLHDLAHRPGSPGRVFKINEDSLAGRLEGFEALTEGAITYDETAGLKQLYRHKTIAMSSALRLVYKRNRSLVGRT